MNQFARSAIRLRGPRGKKNAHPRDFHAQLESEISYFSKRLEYNSLLDIRGRAFET